MHAATEELVVERLEDRFIRMWQKLQETMEQVKEFIEKNDDREKYLKEIIGKKQEVFWCELRFKYNLLRLDNLELNLETYQVFETRATGRIQVIGRLSDDLIAECQKIARLIDEFNGLLNTLNRFKTRLEAMKKLFWTKVETHYHLSGKLRIDIETWSIYQEIESAPQHRCDTCPKKDECSPLVKFVLGNDDDAGLSAKTDNDYEIN